MLDGSTWIRDQLEKLSDPDKKIHYKFGGVVEDKFEIMQKLLEETKQFLTPEDWYLPIGADECWYKAPLDYLRTLDKNIYWVGFPFRNFMGDFTHYVDKRAEPIIKDRAWEGTAQDKDGNILVRGLYEERAIRVLNGFNYFESNFTAIRDVNGNHIHAFEDYKNNRIFIPLNNEELIWNHYGYIGSAGRLLRKVLYHHRRAIPSLIEFERSDLFQCIFYGKGKLLIKEKKLNHPDPISSHPLFKKSRKEILLMGW